MEMATLLLLPRNSLIKKDNKETEPCEPQIPNEYPTQKKVLKNRLIMSLYVENETTTGISDYGAHMSVMSTKDWPESWETTSPQHQLIGIGVPKKIQQSLENYGLVMKATLAYFSLIF